MSKRIVDKNLDELREELAGSPTPGGGTEAQVRTMIQIRLAELQDQSAQALVTATQGLVSATNGLGATTSRLVCATWGLVGATLVLVVAEVILRIFGKA